MMILVFQCTSLPQIPAGVTSCASFITRGWLGIRILAVSPSLTIKDQLARWSALSTHVRLRTLVKTPGEGLPPSTG